MAYERDVDSFGEFAGADLSSSQHRFVKIESGTGDVITTNADEQAVGVLTNDPGDQEDASVEYVGVAKVEAGGSVTANDTVGSDADGKAVTGSSNSLGIAHESGSSGEIIPVQIELGL